jgi:hypothetical protein
MTEFKEELRRMCRNPKCRCKLPEPVENPREAFCTRGCHSSFYRSRCLICEEPMKRKTERQLICGKRACRNALQSRSVPLGYYGTRGVVSPSKKPVNKGPKHAIGSDRGVEWAIAVNRSRIVAPRKVLDTVFARVPLQEQESERLAA